MEQALPRLETWLHGQREALEAAVNGAPLRDSLGALARTAAEGWGGGARAAFFLADARSRSLRHLVGMPAEYAEAVSHIEIGPDSLACGLATHIGRPVLTADVAKDARWRRWLWLAERFHYRACWSFPILSSAGKVVATLAVYLRQPREATQRDLELCALLTHTASIILVQHRESEARAEAERALRRSREDLTRAQAIGKIGSWRLNVQTNELTWSDESYRICGVEKDGAALTYETFLAIVHPDDRERVDLEWKAALGGKPYDIEHRFVVNGRTKWVRQQAELEFDSDGRLLGGFGACRDITEHKQAEEALLWHARRNELLSEAAARLLGSDDPRLLVEDLCRKVMEFLNCGVFFNYLPDERTGRLRLNACAGVSEDDAERIEWLDYGVAICGSVARDGERMIVEDIQQSEDPIVDLVKSFGIDAFCCHPLLIEGRVIGTLSFGSQARSRFSVEDIEVMKSVADLVALAMRRIETERALRETDRRKDEFLAMLAHELRNPLAPIMNGLHVLQSGADGPTRERMLEGMARQANHLVRLVDDLLEVSRISRGRITLQKKRLDLAEIVNDAAAASRAVIAERGHRLTIALPSEPLPLDADPTRLSQIVTNLLNNAAKFTDFGGSIEVSARRESGEVVLSVADDGVGIPSDMLKDVFDLFTQVAGGRGDPRDGLGIGLALVRNLVELHGGRVEACSEGVGRGSTFVVRLPLADTPAGDAAEEPAVLGAPRGSARRILVADDNHDVADSLALLLETFGADVRLAYDGPSTLDAFAAFRPELVFLDIGMAGMDGYETARRLREHPEGREVLLVALTGWGQDEHRRLSRAAGFDEHLVKPLDIRVLESVLASLDGGGPSRSRGPREG